MTNEQVMQLMTGLGLHEGGLENWVHDNAWVTVVNKAIEIEREACAKVCEKLGSEVASPNKRYYLEVDYDKCAAAIRERGSKHVGHYRTVEDAAVAVKLARDSMHKQFARHE